MNHTKAEELGYRGKERRRSLDRRRFSYLVHIPERRSGKHRRRVAAVRHVDDFDPKKYESLGFENVKTSKLHG